MSIPLTVKQLITKLQSLPEDALVFSNSCYDGQSYAPVDDDSIVVNKNQTVVHIPFSNEADAYSISEHNELQEELGNDTISKHFGNRSRIMYESVTIVNICATE